MLPTLSILILTSACQAPAVNAGVQPESSPNAIYATLLSTIISGSLTLTPFGTLAPGTEVTSFDLSEFGKHNHSEYERLLISGSKLIQDLIGPCYCEASIRLLQCLTSVANTNS